MVQPRTGHCLALLCAATRALATGASTEPCVELSEPNSRAWAVRTSPLTRRMHPCSLSLSALRCERASERVYVALADTLYLSTYVICRWIGYRLTS